MTESPPIQPPDLFGSRRVALELAELEVKRALIAWLRRPRLSPGDGAAGELMAELELAGEEWLRLAGKEPKRKEWN